MKKLFVLLGLLFYLSINAQITLIPDPNFESKLILFGIDSDGVINGQVLTSDVEVVTDLFISDDFYTITDITGIEDFTALEHLEFWYQDFTTIDLSNNINLTFLGLATIPIESIDVSNNVNLLELRLSSVSINELDLSANINLEIISLAGTLLAEIDMSHNIVLYNFDVFTNHDLQYINLQNGNNEGVLTLVEVNFSNENVICIQVDDPAAVIEGNPPYQYWEIDESITISDNCGVFSVEDFEKSSLITVYPNPVQNVLYLENNSGYAVNKIKVYDVLGKLVLQEYNPTNQINVSNIASGLLFVHLETDYGVITKKMIKE